MFKKTISVCLAFVMVLIAFPLAAAFAATETADFEGLSFGDGEQISETTTIDGFRFATSIHEGVDYMKGKGADGSAGVISHYSTPVAWLEFRREDNAAFALSSIYFNNDVYEGYLPATACEFQGFYEGSQVKTLPDVPLTGNGTISFSGWGQVDRVRIVATAGTNLDLAAVFDDIVYEIVSASTLPYMDVLLPLTLNEGNTASIPNTLLKAGDGDSDESSLQYTVTAAPAHGRLESADAPGVSITTFTQGFIDSGKLRYVHDDSDTTSDSFVFSVSDGSHSLTSQTFSIAITPVYDPVLPPGATVATFDDLPYSNAYHIPYTMPIDGFLFNTPGNSGMQYYYNGAQDNTPGLIPYGSVDILSLSIIRSDGSDFRLFSIYIDGHAGWGSDTYKFEGYRDGSLIDTKNNVNIATAGTVTFDDWTEDVDEVRITALTGTPPKVSAYIDNIIYKPGAPSPVPYMEVNLPLTLSEGSTASVPDTLLKAGDSDSDVSSLQYTVTSAPVHGRLESADTPGVSLTTFTQGLIDSGKLRYVHDDSDTTSDSFVFKVGDGVNELTGQTFYISVIPVYDDPIPPGATVATFDGLGSTYISGNVIYTGTAIDGFLFSSPDNPPEIFGMQFLASGGQDNTAYLYPYLAGDHTLPKLVFTRSTGDDFRLFSLYLYDPGSPGSSTYNIEGWLDGVKQYTKENISVSPPKTVTFDDWTGFVDEVRIIGTGTVQDIFGHFDNIVYKDNNAAPIASNVEISGTAAYGQTLTGDYDYSDTDSDAEGTSTFKWYRADDASGLNKTAIASAEAETYTLAEADVDKYISFEVTPAAATGTSPGTAVQSDYTAAVQRADCATSTGLAPVLSSKTDTTVTLASVAGYEYIRVADGAAVSTGTWQDNSVFGGLSSSTAYDFYQRVKQTATHKASGISDKLNVTTKVAAPRVTAANISISGGSGTVGAYKIGDTVSAAWDNTSSGDNNGSISTVTFDFSAFGGGSAVPAVNSSGTWTAAHTITAGAIDATNRNVSVTVTNSDDIATTTADTANATVDNIAPTVTDANISLSGGNGTGGTFITGDTVTATWNNTAAGDNNSDTLSAVRVDFSAFGGGSAVSATNSSGTWTAAYTVTAGSIDATNLNASVTVTDNAGNSTTTADTTNAAMDNDAPTVTSVGVPSNGTYAEGQSLDFTVEFSDNVTVTGTPQIAITVGLTTVYASYVSGSGTSALLFRYTVGSGLSDSDGITVGALTLSGGTMRDAAGNNAGLTLNGIGSTAGVLVDTTAPTVVSVSVPANGTYVAGQNLDFTVNFDKAVTVNTSGGIPRITMTVGSATVYARYVSGSGTSALLFRYTVGPGLSDSDGITMGALSLNGGTVRDAAGNNAALTLNGVGSTASVLVDAVVPTVVSVNVPADGTYIAGQNLDFTVNFSEAVTVNPSGGTPRIALTVGSATVYAGYVSGSGTSALLFRYTVGSGLSDSDGITMGTLSLNGGTMRDAAGNNAALTLNGVGSTAGVLVDSAVPTVVSVSVPANGTYTEGQNLDFTVNFSEAVIVDVSGGTPRIALTVGSATVYAGYVSGSGTSALLFRYTVGSGLSDSNGITVGALTLSGGTMRDAAGNDAVLAFTGSTLTDVLVKLAQTITFVNPGAKNFGTSPTLTATSSSGLPVTFTSATPDVATITSAGVLTFLKAGEATIKADQAGNSEYLPAATVSQSFTVNAVVPGAPVIGTALAGDRQATVSFTSPVFKGGADISGYTVTASPGGITASGTSSPITVTGLTNGTAYTFTVTATNSAGTGAASPASSSVTPKASQIITFANPGAKNFGTSPTLTATSSSGLPVTFTSTTPDVATITSAGVLTFLKAGEATIKADQAGSSEYLPAATVSQSFTVNAVVPGAPVIGTALAGDRQATVSFISPLFRGGADISGYTVTASPGGITASGTSSPITVTGLTNGTAYTFTVTATNSAGTGAASPASNSVTPKASAPPAPAPSATPKPTATPTPAPTATPAPTDGSTRTITGTLLDSDGNPMVGYLVELHSEPMTTVTDANGRYAFYGVDYTNHELVVKTPEGEKIAEFELVFSQGDEFGTDMTEKGADITYTSSTATVNIEVKLIPDQSGAAISLVSGSDEPLADKAFGDAGSVLLWIGGGTLVVMLIALLIIILLKERKP